MLAVSSRRVLVRAAALSLLIPWLSFRGSVARGEFLVALGSTSNAVNALVTFDSAQPNQTSTALAVTGVDGRLLDIDYRPANGVLYGLSSTGGLYTINTTTGGATLAATVSTPLSGNQFAIDFNPTVDRLRIISDMTQNLRVNVDTGAAIVDGGLSVAGQVGVAYTNSFAGASTTTLYDLQYRNGSFLLNTQNPPNNGTIVPVGATGISSPIALAGFDISGASGVAYVATNLTTGIAGNLAGLATIDLTTGNVSSFAPLGVAGFQVRGLAAPIGVAVPEPASLAMLGLGMVCLGLTARRRSSRTGYRS